MTAAHLREPVFSAWATACARLNALSTVWELSSGHERKAAPTLTSVTTARLWRIIGEQTEPITRSEWMDLAHLRGGQQRRLGSSAIGNLLHGGWVARTADGKFSRPKQ